jgi:hypothetical protein
MAKKEAAPVAEKDTQNGITRPAEGSASRLVWDTIESLGGNPKAGEVVAAVKVASPDANDSTIKTQLARWRTYSGLTVPRPANDDEEEDEAA